MNPLLMLSQNTPRVAVFSWGVLYKGSLQWRHYCLLLCKTLESLKYHLQLLLSLNHFLFTRVDSQLLINTLWITVMSLMTRDSKHTYWSKTVALQMAKFVVFNMVSINWSQTTLDKHERFPQCQSVIEASSVIPKQFTNVTNVNDFLPN